MKENIILIGGGGHCRSVIDVIELENKFSIVGIIDKKELIGQKVLGYEVIGCDDDLEKLHETYKNAVITVGQVKSKELKLQLFTLTNILGYQLPVIISPLAYVSKHVSIGEGSVVMHHALVNANAKIGKNCIINTKALIEHDAIIEDNCHIATASIINGGVVVKEGTFYGSNATSREYIEVSGFIKAGSLLK